jgi:outer membrane immunogenic protein
MTRMLKAALLTGLATSAFAASASAADLPTRKGPPPAPMTYAPPPFSWTGFYVGINGGFGTTDLNGNTFGPAAGVGPVKAFGAPSGGMIGGTAGYNYQIGQMVFGIEGSLDWADFSKGRTFANGSTNNFRVDSVGNVLGRFGYAWDRTLFYVAGGYAGADVHAGAMNDTFYGASFPGSSSWQSGYAIGGGIEYAMTNNVSVKGQYLFNSLSGKTYYAGTPDAVKTSVDINAFTLGVNYKF